MKRAFIVAGLAFGDEGKGKITDFLVRHYDAKLVVRYNGGCQAAHNVITSEGLHHTFSQFGSGTLAGARTHVSSSMLVEPIAMEREAQVLQEKGIADPFSMLTVDPNCVIITPWHRLMNRLKESLAADNRHGSVGLGVGEARADELAGRKLLASDLRSLAHATEILAMSKERALAPLIGCEKLFAESDPHGAATGKDYQNAMEALNPKFVAHRMCQIFDGVQLQNFLPITDTVVFEGAQGLMLDETHGFAPHNSWTDCTFNNADQLLQDSGTNVERIGVLRTYYTRHGNGPFPTEDPSMNFPELHNGSHPWMGRFRQGKFDWKLAQFAASKVGKLDCIALTHCDRLSLDHWRLRLALGVPVKYLSDGPTAQSTHVR